MVSRNGSQSGDGAPGIASPRRPADPGDRRARRSPSRESLLLAGILTCVSLLYAPALRRWVQGDDFSKYWWANQYRFDLLQGENPFFRPLEHFVNAVNLSLVGPDSSALSLGVSLAGLLISTCLVFAIARRLSPDRRAFPLLAAGYFALHSSAVSAVIQIDTISQQYATVFALFAVSWSISGAARGRSVHFAGLVVLWFFCLVSKETSLGLVFACPLAVLFVKGTCPRLARMTSRDLLVLGLCASAAALAIYLLARSASDANMALERIMSVREGTHYRPSFDPINVLRNTFQLAAATSYLGSTLDLFPSLRLLRVVLSLSMTLIAGAIGLWGLLGLLSPGAHVEAEQRRSGRAILFALLVLYGGSLVPTIALGKVSELYAYSQLPFVALILGYLLVLGWERLPVSGLGARSAAWVAVLSAALWMAVGVEEKVDLAVRNAARSRQIFVALERQIGEMPRAEPLILCPERAGAAGPEYSIFYRSDTALAVQMIPYLSWRHPERQIRMESTRDCTLLPIEARDQNAM